VAVDLRLDSSTYGQWHGLELIPEHGNALLIPEGCAHGFQVLEPGSELLYLHSGAWVPEAETGVRWDDPQLAITWPLSVTDLSDRDRSLPFLLS
jgi:dTDP-4-dehydrorhamnose 3,5-epimerase